jgi:NAD+ kinase
MTFGLVGNLEKARLADTARKLMDRLHASKAAYVVDIRILDLIGQESGASHREHGRSLDACLREADMLVAFGGDGTMLSIARSVVGRNLPILGVNLGKLGFLAEFAPEELERSIGDVIAGRYVVEDRLVLEGVSPALEGKTIRAVNDVVVEKSRSPRIIDFEAHINGAYAVTYRGDGLVISSPTGSTAYALSNGGPIVTPTSAVIGITPIAPHTLSGRPLIVPDSSEIRVVVQSDSNEVLLSADGQIEGFLQPPVEVTVRRSASTIKLVKRMDRSYFDVLRAKLLWGRDPRASSG